MPVAALASFLLSSCGKQTPVNPDNGNGETLILSSVSETVSVLGDEISIGVTSNVNWVASADREWAVMAQPEGSGDGNLVISVAPNTNVNADTTIVRITSSTGLSVRQVVLARERFYDCASDGVENDEPYIDLGLDSGIRWAVRNLGASSMNTVGIFYAWGATIPDVSNVWSWNTYTLCDGTFNTLKRYNFIGAFGTVDNVEQLSTSDDAVAHALGGVWRMPSKDELDELSSKCRFETGSYNKIAGVYVTGPNGKSLFFPKSGYMDGAACVYMHNSFIWSSNVVKSNCIDAYILDISCITGEHSVSDKVRFYGMQVRGVL